MNKQLFNKIKESFLSVFPIACIVIFLQATGIARVSGKQFISFIISTFLLILGMGLFTLGADISMMPMGEYTGSSVTRLKKLPLILFIVFALGVLITIAEPDLSVLANQLPINSMLLIVLVGVGVGAFLTIAVIRIIFQKNLNIMLIISYGVVFLFSIILLIIGKGHFFPVAFDSGGVTTGPITVPFIMSLCVGIAAVRGGMNTNNDSFGMVSLCSVGPIIMVVILSLFMKQQPEYIISEVNGDKSMAYLYFSGLWLYMKEVFIALAPIVVLFLLLNFLFIRIGNKRLLKMSIGILYTYWGLVIFLTAVNIGYLPVGQTIGKVIANSSYKGFLIPLGFLMGVVVVLAEPAIHVLNKQVEAVSAGTISRRAMIMSLSIGVGLSIALSMLRIVLGFSVAWYLIPGYLITLGLTFFIPKIYTAIAFDSGGVASGPMATGFILPLAIGASSILQTDNILEYAFGIVAMIAMVPILAIEILGYLSVAREKARHKTEGIIINDNEIIYFR